MQSVEAKIDLSPCRSAAAHEFLFSHAWPTKCALKFVLAMLLVTTFHENPLTPLPRVALISIETTNLTEDTWFRSIGPTEKSLDLSSPGTHFNPACAAISSHSAFFFFFLKSYPLAFGIYSPSSSPIFPKFRAHFLPFNYPI